MVPAAVWLGLRVDLAVCVLFCDNTEILGSSFSRSAKYGLRMLVGFALDL